MRRPLSFLILSIIFSLFIVFLGSLAHPLKSFLPYINYLLGTEKPTSYLILLGNDAEMRANGGFAGSYAKIILSTKRLEFSPEISFQDIYVPNGQLKGYVTPPAPIQEAFQHGTWELANADWEPDFPTSATTLRWFFEKGNEINPDNLAILNLTTIKKVLDVVGSFTVPEYEAHITPDNLYLFLQGKTEMNFFPGSTQKKDTLTAVGHAFKQALFNLPLNKKIKVAKILYQDLVNQNIVINSQNPDFQAFLEEKNFAGKLISNSPDTYLLVETNLGANKANAYVKRETSHDITFQDSQVTHQVTVKFQNSSLEANPNPPFHYGGNYIAYLRFYLPSNAQNIIATPSSSLRVSPPLAGEGTPTKQPPTNEIKPNISKKYGLIEVGFWQTTLAQNQTSINLTYTLPISPENYSLTILKQSGLVSSPQTINFEGKTVSTPLENDFFIDR